MATHSPSDLARQLSRNSAPYFDPLAKIHWDQLSIEQYWLPPTALSLCGMPAFAALPDAQQRRLSQLEFLSFIEAGLWLESIFMERITRAARRDADDRPTLKYRLHELREEAGHSLMFLEVMERSGLSLPTALRRRLPLAEAVGRWAPLTSSLFRIAVVLGEEIPDRLNRYVRQHAVGVCPAIVEVCTAHIVDEARHIAYAREVLEPRVATLTKVQRGLLRPPLQQLLRQFVKTFYYPRPALYELAGLYPGAHWARAAWANPERTRFVQQCIAPTIATLAQRGLPLVWRRVR